ncbi:ribonuclease T [Thiohalomonas denitrificans]|uniref:Ribonuclease T n=1 Tax=Thiohalomonas denitrificans TaxID=415747 RepID=A0A1G5Q5G8_9GAMM|nr:ribonuclease T [Thiohalomonas denitrificans]SCZ57124.1 ribonuclease T [Thiohalomonas denitrificans]
MSEPKQPKIADRFRGFLPVVVDVETAGFNSKTDALLEIAAVLLHMDDEGCLQPGETVSAHVEPFAGANLDQRSLDFLGIDPFHPFRFAVPEKEALDKVFAPIRKEVKRQECSRAILVGHNPFFDLGFLKEAVRRVKCKKNPFHAFSTFDTATLGGLAFGQTVLARAVKAAGHEWDNEAAHSAAYDAEQTAKLFCAVVNRWQTLEGNLVVSPAPDTETSS